MNWITNQLMMKSNALGMLLIKQTLYLMHLRLLLYMVQISAFTQIFHVHSHEPDVDRLVLNYWCITSLALQMVSLIMSPQSYSTCGHIVIFLLVMFVVYST